MDIHISTLGSTTVFTFSYLPYHINSTCMTNAFIEFLLQLTIHLYTDNEGLEAHDNHCSVCPLWCCATVVESDSTSV